MKAAWLYILTVAALVSAFTNVQAAGCAQDNTPITVKGTATRVSLKLADGKVTPVDLLTLDQPMCVVDALTNEREQVTQIQLNGTPPPTGVAVEISGTLTTGNITQYYAVPTAIDVKAGRRLAIAGVATSSAADPYNRRRAVQVAFVPIADHSYHLIVLTDIKSAIPGCPTGFFAGIRSDAIEPHTHASITNPSGCWSYSPDQRRISMRYIDLDSGSSDMVETSFDASLAKPMFLDEKTDFLYAK